MGNILSNQKEDTSQLKPKSLSQILDYIATYYILTSDFESLKRLHQKEYCDNLVILTSDIIERYFTDMDITYLSQRIKEGVEINDYEKDKILFFTKDSVNKFNVQSGVKKKRMCSAIAKFYIKIAHIFAAIVTTINPVYVYKDLEGNIQKASLQQKQNIPVNAPRQIFKMNICSERIDALKGNQDVKNLSNEDVTIKPNICLFNLDNQGSVKNLSQQPGIPELEMLYYDDQYDFDTGTFKGMTPETRNMYNEDLKIFYSIFTGNTNKSMPENIKKFSDIQLQDYSKHPECQKDNAFYRKAIKGKLSDKLFADYANNLKTMINDANKNQEALLNVLNEIFVYTVDPQSNKKQIRVNPKLTEDKLQEIVLETRALIIKLYLKCEIDFSNGIKLYEAIVEQKILETSQKQIENLNKLSDKLISNDEIPIIPEVSVLKKEATKNIEEKKQELNAVISNEDKITNASPDEIPPVNFDVNAIKK
jgi:hypothetical protein